MEFSETMRLELLQQVFPDECEILGTKNLKKICREEKPEVVQSEHGSNMMFGDLLMLLFQALEFVDTALNVFNHLKKEKPEPTVKSIIHITINNYNLDTSKLTEEKQIELVQKVLEYKEINE